MGELDEQRWSVISERGCETSQSTYKEAVQTVKKLVAEKVSGICIVSDEAAMRLKSFASQESAQSASQQP